MSENPTGADISVSIHGVVAYLNGLLEIDRDAVSRLVDSRVKCSPEMADHPTCQVGVRDGSYRMGILGVLNGIFPIQDDGWAHIVALMGDGVEITRFEVREWKQNGVLCAT